MKIAHLNHVLILLYLLVSCSLVHATSPEGDGDWLRNNLQKPPFSLPIAIVVTEETLRPMKENGDGAKTRTFAHSSDSELLQLIQMEGLEAGPYIELYQRRVNNKEYEAANTVLSNGLVTMLGELENDSSNWGIVDEVLKIYQVANQRDKAKKLLTTFLEINPDNVDALIALANVETIAGNFANAKRSIFSAYERNPKATSLYVALFHLLARQNIVELSAEDAGLALLLQASREYPSFKTPQTIYHLLMVTQVFYSSLAAHYEQLADGIPFDFSLDKSQQDKIDQAQTYFEVLGQDESLDPHLSNLALFIAAINENDQIAAKEYFTKLSSLPGADPDVYRLMVVHELSKAKSSQAAEYLQLAIERYNQIDDTILLAALYARKKEFTRSLETLLGFEGRYNADIIIHQLSYALSAGDIELAAHIFTRYKNIRQLWARPYFVYYAAVLTQLQGNADEASRLIDSLPKDSRLQLSGLDLQNKK